MSDKIYPAIYKTDCDETYLYISDSEFYCLEKSEWLTHCDDWECDEHKSDKNITREYLEGKCVKIESPEHSEFVRVLCEVNDIDIANGHLNCVFAAFYDGAMFFCNKLPSDGFKQITIPLPPKAEPEPKEWPVVGDTATWGLRTENVEIIAIHDKMAWTLSEYGTYHDIEIAKLSKPKTEAEILRDELGSILDSYILGDEPKSYYIEKIIKLF